LPRTGRALAHVAEHSARSLEELGAVFLTEHALRKTRAFLLDHRRVEHWVLPRRGIPALVVGIDSLPATEQLVEPALPARRRNQKRPPFLVNQALREMALPDRGLQSRGFVDDHEVKAFAEQRHRVVGGLPADL